MKPKRRALSAAAAATCAPYRSLDLGRMDLPEPRATTVDTDEAIGRTLLFIWATAAIRFVIVCRRHEAYTADPLFAALLTFGLPTVVLVRTVTAWLRSLGALLASWTAALFPSK